MKDNFFNVTSTESARELAEWVHDAVDLETVICAIDPAHQRSGRRLSNLTVVLPKGAHSEFVWTWQNELLVREDVAKVLSSAGITGFVTAPVNARTTGKQPVYLELVVTGWAGLAPESSGIREITRCEGCGYVTYSCWTDPELLIDVQRWDGSDFFMVWPLPVFKFVTARVARLVQAEGWKGIRVRRLAELQCRGTLSPGRLRDHVLMSKAEQIAAENKALVL